MKEFTILTLPNGIRCIHKQVRSGVTHCALTVGAGTRDESAGEYGMAHFVEHMLFKGTERRRAWQVNCRLENLGGELNAYTTKEETVVHATTLRTDFAKAVELIADIVFRSTFPQREAEREKEIIRDEINSYKDNPPERIYDDFEESVFEGSPLGHNILGNKSSLARFRGADAARFVARTYHTDRMVFSSIGNLSPERFSSLMQRYFGSVAASPRNFVRETTRPRPAFFRALSRSTHQTHCIVGGPAYPSDDTRRVALSLLVNLLGGPSANSLLNVLLREKNGLSYTVEAGYTPYSDTGIATIYFSCEKENTEQCLELIRGRLDRLRREAVTPRQLAMAKRQFVGQLCIAMESNEGYMLSAGKSLLVYDAVDSLESIYARIASLSVDDLVQAAEETFSNVSTLVYR